MKYAGAVLCVALLVAGCASDTGSAPLGVDGVWVFQVLNSGCPEVIGIANGSDGLQAEVFNVTQTGQQVAAQFVDNGGNDCSLSGTYVPDQFRGTLTVEESEGRTLVLSAEGIARAFGSRRQVDGWARVEQDTFGDCEGAIIEFCAVIQGEGDQTPTPPPPPPPPSGDCPPIEVVIVLDTNLDTAFAQELCDAIDRVQDNLVELGLPTVEFEAMGTTFRVPGTCVEREIETVYGGQVPGNPPPGQDVLLDVPFEGAPGDFEARANWGAGAAIVADRRPWRSGYTRVILPLSSVGPTGRPHPTLGAPFGACDSIDEAVANNTASVADDNSTTLYYLYLELDGNPPECRDVGEAAATSTGGGVAVVRSGDGSIQRGIEAILLDVCDIATLPPPPPPPPPGPLTDEQVIALCGDITLVFIMDTSASMADDAAALEIAIQALVTRLQGLGATVQSDVLGITETGAQAVARINNMFSAVQDLVNMFSPIPITVPLLPAGTFSNITQTVEGRFDDSVPLRGAFVNPPRTFSDPIGSAPPKTIIPGVSFNFSFESWASAVAIIANDFGFGSGTVPIVIPMSDECAEEGNAGELFSTVGTPGFSVLLADRGDCDQGDVDATSNAILVAQEQGVIVSPIQAFLFDTLSQALGQQPIGFHPQVASDMDRIAAATGGRHFQITEPGGEMADTLFDLIVAACRERLESQEN